jgi:hypothetical protein
VYLQKGQPAHYIAEPFGPARDEYTGFNCMFICKSVDLYIFVVRKDPI